MRLVIDWDGSIKEILIIVAVILVAYLYYLIKQDRLATTVSVGVYQCYSHCIDCFVNNLLINEIALAEESGTFPPVLNVEAIYPFSQMLNEKYKNYIARTCTEWFIDDRKAEKRIYKISKKFFPKTYGQNEIIFITLEWFLNEDSHYFPHDNEDYTDCDKALRRIVSRETNKIWNSN